MVNYDERSPLCIVDEDVYYDISDEQSALDFAH